eukprot:3790431-Rhodomonas_salina.1
MRTRMKAEAKRTEPPDSRQSFTLTEANEHWANNEREAKNLLGEAKLAGWPTMTEEREAASMKR